MGMAFVQLGSYGDNINSTLMLPALKSAYPDTPIEVHTTTLYESAFHNNQYVNNLISYPARNKTECFNLYNVVPQKVRQMPYDTVVVPAPILHPEKRNSLLHPEFGNNIICTFMRILEDMNIVYEWPLRTVLRLRKDEIDKASQWLIRHHTNLANNLVLMEVHGESGQTFWDHNWTLAVVRYLAQNKQRAIFISNKSKTAEIIQLEREFANRVWWVGDLTLRECAELFNKCHVFLGVSSGLSNVCHTDHCKKDIIWAEVINSPSVNSAPLRAANKTFWYENNVQRYLKKLQEIGL